MTDRKDGYLLLRINPEPGKPVHIIVKDRDTANYTEEEWRYFVDEGTCPINLLRNPIEAIIEGDDEDPHGLLEFIAWAPVPPADADKTAHEWTEMFPILLR